MPENTIPMKTLKFPDHPEVYEIVDEAARNQLQEKVDKSEIEEVSNILSALNCTYDPETNTVRFK